MALQRLDLNLVPAPSLWERHHLRLGWGALALGLAVLVAAVGATGWTYWQARSAGREAINLTDAARKTALEQQRLEATLADVDVGRELPRWRTAERVLQERALPWSRLMAELEMDLPDGMRLRTIQRLRGRDGVTMKLKGEARSRDAEEAFIDALRANPTYAALSLERESERTGGGVELELTLTAAPVPPAFAVRPQPKVKGKDVSAPPRSMASSPLKPQAAPNAPAFSTRTKPEGGRAPAAVAPPGSATPSRPSLPPRPGPMPSRGGRAPRPEAS